jgi:hypothetical protein
MSKGSVLQEDVTGLNAFSHQSLKMHETKTKEMKREIDVSTIILGDFKASLNI